jgi:tetratricopeptide (TPR) repeat protein
MRWIACVVLSFVLIDFARAAAGPDDQYLDVYNEILQADTLKQDRQYVGAADKFLQAQTALQKIKADYPTWNPDVVAFRLQYLDAQLQTLSKYLPSNPAPVPSTPTTPQAPPPGATMAQQIAGLQEQVRALTDANTQLESRLKEALSVQPAAVSPVELAKREEEILALEKEKDLLTVALTQSKANPPAAPKGMDPKKLAADLAAAKAQEAEAKKKIEAMRRDLEMARAAAATQSPSLEIARLEQERDKLKAELDARSKDLADAEARGDSDVVKARAQARDALAQRDDLQRRLEAVATDRSAADKELESLRARLAVFESKPVPYTPEELAAMNQVQAKAQPPAQLPVSPAPASPNTPAAQPPSVTQTSPPAQPQTPAQRPHIAHSIKDLPPGAGALMAEALRARMEHDYAQAEAKYQEVLRQDENNVYVLGYLANAQYALGHLDDCEKTINRALALDPDDPAALYVLGVLRYRQEKFDAAMDALSRSAKFNPTNAYTENYLGCVMADKGLRSEAETALRKAIELQPDYSDAHYNLALIYASAKPPSPGLARWHYKRALDLGHPKSDTLEKLLKEDK